MCFALRGKLILTAEQAASVAAKRHSRIVRVEDFPPSTDATLTTKTKRPHQFEIDRWNIRDLVHHDNGRRHLPHLATLKRFISDKSIREQEVLLFYDDEGLSMASCMLWLFRIWGRTTRLINCNSADLHRQGCSPRTPNSPKSQAIPNTLLQPSFESKSFVSYKRLKALVEASKKYKRTTVFVDTRTPGEFKPLLRHDQC